MALFLPPARQRSVMSCDTAQMGADQAVPADKQSLVCASMPLSSPTSIWIRACSSSSRDQQTSLPFRRRCIEDAPPLPLVCGGGALAPHTLPWALSSFHEVRVAHWLHVITSHCFVLCSSECAALHSRLLRSMCHHIHQQQQMRLSPLLARMAAASAADACARQQADRLHCHWPDELLLLRGGWCFGLLVHLPSSGAHQDPTILTK